MSFDQAIERQRKPLLNIVAALFAMIGLADGGHVERLSSPLYRAVLRVLRPAESAVRRLIIVAARGITLKPAQPRTTPRHVGTARRSGRRHSFQLFDPRQRFSSVTGTSNSRRPIRLVRGPEPRLRVIDVSFDPRVPLFRKALPVAPVVVPEPDDSVSAIRISRRLAAIKLALEDLPRQARRYLRWQAKPLEARRPMLSSALRRGQPPGYQKNPLHKVDEILAECDWLARRSPLADSS